MKHSPWSKSWLTEALAMFFETEPVKAAVKGAWIKICQIWSKMVNKNKNNGEGNNLQSILGHLMSIQ